ncbi:MAG: hypothetical protein ACR2HG_10550 [Pyrinomonadaceae bacterium]
MKLPKNKIGLHKNSESCTKIEGVAQKLLLEFANYLWHKSYVPIFIERFLLPILATIAISVIMLNPMGMNLTQKITLGLSILFFAFFLAYTLHLYNESKNNLTSTANSNKPSTDTTSLPMFSNAELKQEVSKVVAGLYDFDQRMEAMRPHDLFYQKGEDYLAAKTEEEKSFREIQRA